MPDTYIVIFAGILGLMFGSFANVIIWRVPQKISIVRPRSYCPGCKRRLRFFELIPVVSYVFLCGKCRTCKSRISPQEPLVELLCGGLFAAMAVHSPTLSLVPLAILAFALVAIAFIDAATMEIPNGLVITVAVAGIFYVSLGNISPADALLGALAGAVPLFLTNRLTLLVLKKDGFGFGDVKLMAAAGLFIGWRLMLPAFFFALVTGAAVAVFLLATGRAKRGGYMAFAPFLCLGVIFSLWFGEKFLAWYFALL